MTAAPVHLRLSVFRRLLCQSKTHALVASTEWIQLHARRGTWRETQKGADSCVTLHQNMNASSIADMEKKMLPELNAANISWPTIDG